MIFTKDLLLKGLAGLALCTGTAALGVHYMGGFSSLYKEVNITRVEDIGLTTSNECKLPEAGTTQPTSCAITDQNIGNIEFEGKSTTQTSLTGTGTLQISIPNADEKDIFPHGYKVTITASGNDITINRNSGGNIVLKTNQATEFKIIQKEGNTFALEKAWTKDLLAKKAGLNKENDGRWTLGAEAIKVKYESGNTETKTAASGQTGKIKAVEDTSYNQGFKFVIEDGDITLTSGAGEGNTITKLEELETYEIKKEGDAWVLVRKTKAFDEIKKAIALPAECTMSVSNEAECALNEQAKLSAIKFEGKNGNVTTSDNTYSNIKLKVSKTTDTNFTFGYKFVLESAKDITISQTGTSLVIKANTNTEFKIKKGEENSWSLEKAWTVGELAKKVKLTTCQEDAGNKKCSFSETISVYEGESNKVVNASITTTGKKITYQEEQPNYNQGFKFYIPNSETDITISGTATGAGVTAPTAISKETSAGGAPTYEIKEEGGVWYLAKKSGAGG